ncbi:CRISPR-associated protein [Chloroflexus islandicus]|uniref:CRISPR-associated protein n=1 Tax=Chloroflexus islandicus TaxID=1707952 RepID=A0A178M6X1_9CHLR|nr:TIGR02221 family CRISPR-associated protein [Chloroflexus islandicus]OAN43795.1 CRISPR-associated protein [Chloroflexus islandicus]
MKAITFLGARPQETCYVFPDGREHIAPFFGLALAQYLSDLDLVVFTTELTAQFYNQHFASAQAASIQAVRIPDGRDDDELWRIFQAVVEVIEPNEAVVFDITHGFRSLPFLSFLAAAYLRKVKAIQLKHVFFGNFEMRDQSATPHRTPVLDLTNFVELLDWMVGADLFVRFGDARDLAGLLRNQHQRLRPVSEDRDAMRVWANSPLKLTAEVLDIATRSLRVVRPADAMRASAQIMQRLPAVEHEIGALALPFTPLAQQIIDNFRPIALGETEQADPLRTLQTELNLVGWYLDRGQVFQAVALAREWLVSWVMVQLGKGDRLLEKTERQLVEQTLGAAVQVQRGGTGKEEIHVDLNAIPSLKEVINLYNQLGDLRNDLMHAGKRKQPQGAQKVEERAKRLYESLKNTCRLPS